MGTKQTATPRTTLAFAGALAICAVGSAAEAQAAARPSPEQMAMVRDICLNVMRIQEGFVSFYACVESLSRTAGEKSSNRVVSKGTAASFAITRPEETSYSQSNTEQRIRKEEYACAQLGILPGSPRFGRCVAELDNSLRSVEHFE